MTGLELPETAICALRPATSGLYALAMIGFVLSTACLSPMARAWRSPSAESQPGEVPGPRRHEPPLR